MPHENDKASESGRMSILDPRAELPCEQAELLISRHLDGELRDADAARLDTHLSSCGGCRDTLGNWQDASRAASNGLGALWARPNEKPIGRNETRIRGLARPGATGKARKKTKAGIWLPIGMAASQCAAFLLVGLYCLFWPQRVEAPYTTALSEPDLPPMRHAIAPSSPGDAGRAVQSVQPAPVLAPVPLPRAQAAQTPDGPAVSGPRGMPSLFGEARPAAQWPGTEPWRGDRSETVVLASFDRPARDLEVVDNVGSSFCVETRECATACGTLALLSDRTSGEMYVRITGADSSTREIASGEIESLDPALRAIVRRFLDSYGQRR